jgi:hypothetical protein
MYRAKERWTRPDINGSARKKPISTLFDVHQLLYPLNKFSPDFTITIPHVIYPATPPSRYSKRKRINAKEETTQVVEHCKRGIQSR